jgi:hypothetical protein
LLGLGKVRARVVNENLALVCELCVRLSRHLGEREGT